MYSRPGSSLLSASRPWAAVQALSGRLGFVIPAEAGIQDSCDCSKRREAPAYAGATFHGVASALFLESFSAPRCGPGDL